MRKLDEEDFTKPIGLQTEGPDTLDNIVKYLVSFICKSKSKSLNPRWKSNFLGKKEIVWFFISSVRRRRDQAQIYPESKYKSNL